MSHPWKWVCVVGLLLAQLTAGVASAAAPLAPTPGVQHAQFATAQQQVSPKLTAALEALANSGTQGAQIAQTIQNQGTVLAFDDELQPPNGFLPTSVLGFFLTPADAQAAGLSDKPYIVVNSDLRAGSAATLAALLAHEGQHEVQILAQGLSDAPPFDCLARELDAFGAQAQYWQSAFPNGQFPPENLLAQQSNTLVAAQNPAVTFQVILGILSAYAPPPSMRSSGVAGGCLVTPPTSPAVPGNTSSESTSP